MTLRFSQPVQVLVGLGFPRRIESVSDALVFLQEQPLPLRDIAFDATVETCRDALRGSVRADEVEAVFTAFARRRRILVDEPMLDQPHDLAA